MPHEPVRIRSFLFRHDDRDDDRHRDAADITHTETRDDEDDERPQLGTRDIFEHPRVERQGRVFGFAVSIEQAASPVTAFLIGPLTQFILIPFMTNGWGAQNIGSWFGTGPARGMALVFTLTGIIGVAMTLLAFRSRAYRALSKRLVGGETA